MSTRRAGKRNRELEIPNNVVLPKGGTTQFSFKHLQRDHLTFDLTHCTPDYWTALALKLQEYSWWPYTNFVEVDHKENRHEIDFSGTRFPNGFDHLDDQVGTTVPFQFRIGAPHSPWRVAGFILEETFFIVWLDTNHMLY